MRQIRSNAKSRFWLFGDHQYTAVREEFFFWNLLMGGLFLGGVIAAAVVGIGALLDLNTPEAAFQRLKRPLTAEALEAGWVRLAGRVVGDRSTPDPLLCLVTQEVKSGKSWREVWRSTIIKGATLEVTEGEWKKSVDEDRGARRWTIDPAGVRWQPARLQHTERLSLWTRINRDLRSGRVYERCLQRGEQVFIEGCRIRDHHVGACGHRLAVITPGDGTSQPRLDEMASSLLIRLSFLAVSCLLVLIYLWRLVRQRGLPRALIRWNPSPAAADHEGGATPLIWFLMVGPLLLFVGYWLLRWLGGALLPEVSRQGYLVAVIALGWGAVVMLLVTRRQRLVRHAMAPVIEAPTSPLARVRHQNQVVELAVRVKGKAPTTLGPLSHSPRAFYRLVVDMIHRVGKNHEKTRVHTSQTPEQVPVEDDSGEGLLDLRHVVFDLRAEQHRVKSRAIKKGHLSQLLHTGSPWSPDPASMLDPVAAYVLEEQYIDPGERLYVLGRVRDLRPSPEGSHAYRESSVTPIVGGSHDSKLILYAGSEQTLLAALQREVRYLSLLRGAAGLICAALMALTLFLASM